ncbi:hypothetical protein [Asticcacaulis sp.]|uniref:hypothetical protein n=1 Tax=Asticcacaulis sp. TaxID=1872648 RepID=UPI0031D92953
MRSTFTRLRLFFIAFSALFGFAITGTAYAQTYTMQDYYNQQDLVQWAASMKAAADSDYASYDAMATEIQSRPLYCHDTDSCQREYDGRAAEYEAAILARDMAHDDSIFWDGELEIRNALLVEIAQALGL